MSFIISYYVGCLAFFTDTGLNGRFGMVDFPTDRTIIVYMAANNDIEEMQSGAKREVLNDIIENIEKDVAVSYAVTAIKTEMRQLIEAQETALVPANGDRTGDEPQNDETRQGDTPDGAALPP
jgi:hypothetical protein